MSDDPQQPEQRSADQPAESTQLGASMAGTPQARHSIETLIGRTAVERGFASRDAVAAAFAILKPMTREQRALQFEPLFVSRGILTPDQIARLREELKQASDAGTPVAGASNGFIPGYDFVRKLGAGAMGTVVLAKQRSLERLVAIKLLPKKFAQDQQYIDRFYKEGKAAAKLNDPNIVAAYDVGQSPSGEYFFVMEYIDGDTVFDRIQSQRRIPEREALRIVRQAASALQHAHERGFIHRDVKPKNLMINRSGTVKLADLGLARAESDADAASEERGKIFGTPYYISPEQIRARPVTPATDIYGLGATLYHMVTGRVPFEGTAPKEVMAKHLRDALVPPDQLVPELSGGLALIIEMMMAKDPRERYRNAAELLEDLDRVAAGEPPIHARPKFDAPGHGIHHVGGAAEPSVAVTPVGGGGGGLFSSTAGVVLAAVAGISLALNLALLLILLLKR
ncbi:MAG: serine/threonine-protein kinase [Phycisphaerales bacterium]